MPLVLTNPEGQTSFNRDSIYVVPYCPRGAAVLTYDCNRPGHRPNTYALRRSDWAWGTDDLKINAAGRLYPSISRHSYLTRTLHDCDTGQLVAMPREVLPFGTPNGAAMNTVRTVYERTQNQRKNRTRLCKYILDAIESDLGDTQDWAGEFYDMCEQLGTDSCARFVKFIEGKTGKTADGCERTNCEHQAFHFEEVRAYRRTSESWCINCQENHSTYVDNAEEYVCNDHVVTVDNDFSATIWYAQDNYYQDDDGDWYSEPQDRDDDNDGAGDSETPELYHYHTTKSRLRGWTMAPDGQPDISRGCWAPMTIGIELEVEAKDSRHDTVAPLVYALRDVIGGESLFAERDGSLDENKGFELIFGWSDLPSWQRAMPRIGAELKDGDVISHDAGTNYGLHVNVAVAQNNVVQGAITWFINNSGNDKLLYALARRDSTPYCPRSNGRYEPSSEHNMAVNFGNTAGQFKASPEGKTADCDSTIASFRLFRGTISPVRLMADIEFCHSLVSAATEYSYRLGGGSYVELSAGMFKEFSLRYWQTHVLKNITRYPTLVNYLRGWDKKHTRPRLTHYSPHTLCHGAFSNFALARFVSKHPMGAWTGATHDGLDKRALAVLSTTLQSNEE